MSAMALNHQAFGGERVLGPENAAPPVPAPFAACQDQFPGNTVPKAKSQTIQDLCKLADGQPLFAIRYDTARKIPTWTVHKLTPDLMAQIKANSGVLKRPKFTPDEAIKADLQAIDKNYVRSGYARGHIVPANDMSWSKAAYDTTFHFSNVVPQKQTFNAGTWLGEEDAFRTYVAAKNVPMWIYSGVFGTNKDDPETKNVTEGPTIGTAPNAPIVPTCFYKIIVAAPEEGQPYKVLASLFRWNDYGKRNTWVESVSTLKTIQTRSGIDFLGGLPLEADFDATFWGVKMPETPGDCQ
ncbi:hypothetical protein BEN30_14675 [Magnetovibrio blakemorei]|uniref:Endonuclease n=2 Tax=Magnetovibrio blakemorei TaxID=28181 RepID=A0A1E5Q5I2_9PROT|nr:hypothetical protein BEN30_14675 [Magnetovibrio blakemorei]